MTTADVDVFIVGAGPTGLALAAGLNAAGASFRIVDRQSGPVRESRALGVQPRTLEVLAPFGVTPALVAAGNPATQLRLHMRGDILAFGLFDIGIADTAYPYLLFLSQAETERVLIEHLAADGVLVERGAALTALSREEDLVECTLEVDGASLRVRARYLVGCDGAHSAVRELAGIPFSGARYPQTFLLADLEVDGLEPGVAHAFLTRAGPLLFFPLEGEATWRLIAMRRKGDANGGTDEATLGELRQIVASATSEPLRLRDPVWMTVFHLANRGAEHYRDGRVFLAGDAAHVHSPAGAQGMNTGIQDAVNLAWKLAGVCSGASPESLLDSYAAEREPVGELVRSFTDRAYRVATSDATVVSVMRDIVPRLALPLARAFPAVRALAFRTISELGISYRGSPAVAPWRRPPWRGPVAGDRMPDAPLMRDGMPASLHEVLGMPGFHLLLVGPERRWRAADAAGVIARRPGWVTVHRLTSSASVAPVPPNGTDRRAPGMGEPLSDPGGIVHRRLGVRPGECAQFLVRPDGHLAWRGGGVGLDDAERWLGRWLLP
ncbi:FAD-dependent monooxygenase [Luethyella okanaganae]|uniref:FAD-dependent monooxygenase n=1 Tax=Luethyella okanaganae TaxID=69372 RepID=A0ABW1VJE5_9MICO